jgi:UDP-GlcNAc:undecaprenyl-phosphate/decaprenyl-phosphate GlcNAc-1-phosphate transferase
MLSLYVPMLVAALATAVVVFFLRPLAHEFNFVDRPGGRKIHSDEVPVVGGIGMFVGLAIGVSLLPEEAPAPVAYVALAFVFVMMGILDDRLDLSPKLRLGVQAFSAVVMVYFGSLSVHYIGSPFGWEDVIFIPAVAIGLTLLLVVGAVNAFNMVDGIDGLAGSLGVVALLGVLYAAIEGSDAVVFGMAITLLGAVFGFLVFNLPLGINKPLRTFMGDAGSMLIGFSLSWCLVALSQNPTTVVAPVTLLWFVAVPIFDLISTAVGRVLRGVSPFKPDTTHFHHVLLSKRLSARLALLILVVTAAGLAVVGVVLDTVLQVPEWVSFVAFLVAGVLVNIFVRGVGRALAPSTITS